MTPDRVADFDMTHPFGYFTAGLIRRMPDANVIHLTNFYGLRADIDLIVYVMYIFSALALVVVYSIAYYANDGSTDSCAV